MVYINTIVLIVVLTTQFSLNDFHDASAIVNGLSLFIEATLFLGIFFVPKVSMRVKCRAGSVVVKVAYE